MRRTMTLFSVVVMMLATMITPAAAARPMLAEGSIDWYTGAWDEPRLAGPNTFVTGTEEANWMGSLSREAVDTFRAVFQRDGDCIAKFVVELDAKVGDAEGTLWMALTFWSTPEGDAGGKWVITEGTGELTTLSGNGTWVVTGGDDVHVYADYTGKMKFDE